jgi:hypothetical protein
VTSALALARSYGVAVRFAQMGEWGGAELLSEYDPLVPEIRVNVAVAARLTTEQLAEFVALAVGHELYHHREAIREIERLRPRSARESAADEFARALLDLPA